MERTLENKIRMTTRALLDELLETVEKETAGLQDDTSSRLKQATDRIRAKLEVIDEFDRYDCACTRVRKVVDDALKKHQDASRMPPGTPGSTKSNPDDYMPNPADKVSWPPPYWLNHHTWVDTKGWGDGFNPSQFPCEVPPASQFPCETSPDTTGSKPPVWKPCTTGTCETYNVMYSDKTSGGMQ